MGDDRPPPKAQEGGRSRIVVEVVHGSDPIRGEVADKGFSGWMELIDELERARARDPEDTGARPR